MSGIHWREWLLGVVAAGGVAAALWMAPIPQDPAYHEFADRRTIFALPNCWNVLSSFLFVLVGLFGLSRMSRLHPSAPRSAFLVFCIGVALVGLGSAYYHSFPSTPTLAWDRLPMAITFMALFSMVVRDRVSVRLGDGALWPLVLAGAVSAGYWYWSELQGRGDLRAYVVIQFLPMVLMPLMLTAYRGRGLSSPWLWATLGTYVLAKVAEHSDQAIFDTTGMVSGHSLKHVLGALAALWVVFAIARLRRR